MATTYRLCTVAEMANSLKDRIEAILDSDSKKVFKSIGIYQGSKYRDVHKRLSGLALLPGALIVPGRSAWTAHSRATERVMGWSVFIRATTPMSGEGLGDIHTLAELIQEDMSPVQGADSEITIKGVQWILEDAHAVDMTEKLAEDNKGYDHYRINFSIYDRKRNRDDNGEPV